MADIIINEAAFDALLHDVTHIVLDQLSADVLDIARVIVPVQHRTDPLIHHHHPPGGGRLKASVTRIVSDSGTSDDDAYAIIGGLFYGRFLEPKARQLHYTRPFLPTALVEGVDGRVFYF